jgi:hypothetical protein
MMYTRRSLASTSLPAASIRSSLASALEPSSVMTWPLTRTCPLRMSCSAWRREAMPARAIIFCKRSSIFLVRCCALSIVNGFGENRTVKERFGRSLADEVW